jgi:hypothetical protein
MFCQPASTQGNTCMNVGSAIQGTRSNPIWPVISGHTSSLRILITSDRPYWLHLTSLVFTTPATIPSSSRNPSNCSHAGKGEIALWHVWTALVCKPDLGDVTCPIDLDVNLLRIQISCSKCNRSAHITLQVRNSLSLHSAKYTSY